MATRKDINEVIDVVAETGPIVEEKPKDLFVTRRGLRIKLKSVDPMLIKKSQDSVKLPDRPTYQAETRSGKVETFPLDGVSAEQVPNGKARWLAYLETRNEAFSQRNDNMVRSFFYYGTEMIDPIPTDWMEEQEALGIEVPTHQNPKIAEGLLRAHYLATHLNKDELGDLISAINRMMGVTEEDIQEAEAMFRS